MGEVSAETPVYDDTVNPSEVLTPDDQIQQNTGDLYAIFILDIVMKKRMK